MTAPEVRHLRVGHHEGLYQELEVARHQEVPAKAGQDVEGSDLLRDVEELPGVSLEEGEELGAGPRLPRGRDGPPPHTAGRSSWPE